ncbi:hypothetical protein [Methylocella sp.]|uniref:hypothetical protein n=1 Tax=Methylocella sp. TaxID=1978226 RepID=UPI003782DE1A
MLSTGRQLAAARALLGFSLADLSRESGVAEAAIAAMEAGPGQIDAPAPQVEAVAAAIEAAGVELLGDGRPGVRRKSALGDDATIELEELNSANDGGAG